MGKFKGIFVACLGLGIAAGAGYYLYRKFISRNDEEENNGATQSGACTENEDNTSENLSKAPNGHEDDSTCAINRQAETSAESEKVSGALTKDNGKAVDTAAVTDSASQPNETDKQEQLKTSQQKPRNDQKSNFGGLRKGFLL